MKANFGIIVAVFLTVCSPSVVFGLDFTNIDITKINLNCVKEGAQRGDAYSQYILGFCFLTGKYVSPDMQKAIEWFNKSSEQEYIDAMVVMGEFYYLGVNGYLQQDKEKAKGLFKKAAIKGSKGAKTWLRNIKRDEESRKF